MVKKIVPRGIRNNNPLNIRIGNVWLGEVDNPTDKNFEQFKTMEYGIRAGFVLLRRYINHYKRETVSEIIEAWAPASENNTTKYIDTVCSISGIGIEDKLSYFDSATMVKLVDAMIRVECGQPVDMKKIELGYKMA